MLGNGDVFAAADITTVGAEQLATKTIVRGDVMGREWQSYLDGLATKRAPFAGVALDRPRLMGIVNVTPDSFSDGGKSFVANAAVAHGVALAEAGADIVDVGGESTRPGATPVSPDEEVRRVLPVVAALTNRGLNVSIDSRNASTMAAALSAGATIINDVNALRGEGAINVAAQSSAAVILMHMQGDPATMQLNPRYVWAPGDIYDFLAERIAACVAAGLDRSRIAIDPGIGFGKNDDHICAIFDHLALFHGLGTAVVLGASRKGFIGRAGGGELPEHRLAGSISAALAAVTQGIQLVRVHDVAETRRAFDVWRSIA